MSRVSFVAAAVLRSRPPSAAARARAARRGPAGRARRHQARRVFGFSLFRAVAFTSDLLSSTRATAGRARLSRPLFGVEGLQVRVRASGRGRRRGGARGGTERGRGRLSERRVWRSWPRRKTLRRLTTASGTRHSAPAGSTRRRTARVIARHVMPPGATPPRPGCVHATSKGGILEPNFAYRASSGKSCTFESAQHPKRAHGVIARAHKCGSALERLHPTRVGHRMKCRQCGGRR